MIKTNLKYERSLEKIRKLVHSGFIIKEDKLKELVANGSLIILKKSDKFPD